MRGLLVTGGAGFVGTNFVHHCLERYPGLPLVVLDTLTGAGRLESLQAVKGHRALKWIHADIADQDLVERILREQKLDTIVHFAAAAHADRPVYEPDAFAHTDILETHALLKAARQVWLQEHTVDRHRFHYVSTDEPHGSGGEVCDHLVHAYYHTYGLQVTTSNCSNSYGPHQPPEELIPLAIINILLGRPLPIYADGRDVRNWLHVGDHCRGIDSIAREGVPGESYNIGGNSQCTNLALVRLLCAIADQTFSEERSLRRKYSRCPAAAGASTTALVTFVPERPGHERQQAAACARTADELGFRATICLEDGLRQTFDWYTQNDGWWQGVTARRYPDRIRYHDEPELVIREPDIPALAHCLR